MNVHTRERDIRPGFDGVKIKCYYYYLTVMDLVTTISYHALIKRRLLII